MDYPYGMFCLYEGKGMMLFIARARNAIIQFQTHTQRLELPEREMSKRRFIMQMLILVNQI